MICIPIFCQRCLLKDNCSYLVSSQLFLPCNPYCHKPFYDFIKLKDVLSTTITKKVRPAKNASEFHPAALTLPLPHTRDHPAVFLPPQPAPLSQPSRQGLCSTPTWCHGSFQSRLPAATRSSCSGRLARHRHKWLWHTPGHYEQHTEGRQIRTKSAQGSTGIESKQELHMHNSTQNSVIRYNPWIEALIENRTLTSSFLEGSREGISKYPSTEHKYPWSFSGTDTHRPAWNISQALERLSC